jgi:isopentenyl diphosphate isomerase/L-lactate dehydrogenase-like FMN-dependent dehydrogenase
LRDRRNLERSQIFEEESLSVNNVGQQMQLEVYGSAVAGKRIELPFSFDEWEARAKATLPENAYWYIAGAAGGGHTMRANRAAFDRVQLIHRTLNDVSVRDISTEILGTRIPAPFLLAPIGVQGIMPADGERVPARAAKATGIPFTLSTVSSVTMEEIASIMGDSPRWFQLYPARNRDVATSMVSRAEKSGYSAIVVTLDTPVLGWREQDLRLGYLPFLEGKGIANYLSDPVFRASLAKTPEEDPRAAIMQFLGVFTNPSFGWADVDWLRTITKLPILLKGVVHPDDGRKALDHGVSGIVVSNHGGRQLDGEIGTLDALPAMVEAVDGKIPLLVDSGVRHGADVIKALAIGASAVMLGRPYAYAMASHGEEGVVHLIRSMMADIDLQLALCGLTSIAGINRSVLAR